MLGPHNVYFIWYGNWSGNTATTILPDLAGNIGGSPYFNINTTYYHYPWYDLALGFVVFPDRGQTAPSEVSAAAQLADGRIGLSPGGMSAITPNAGART